MKKFAGACLILVMIFQSCKQPDIISADEAKQALHRFDQGWETKNAAIVDSILGEKYIYFTQSGGSFDRLNVVKTAGSPDYQIRSVEREIVSIQVTGNTAIVNTTWRGKGSYFGNAFDDFQRCSVTLVKQNGKIKIVSEHCTLIK